MSDKDELRTKWVAALRSGDYKQGRSELRTPDDEYCCLGVAGNVMGIPDEELTSYQIIREAYGLQDELGYYADSALVIHNDSDNWTFNRIADLIESKPKGLFVD